MELHILDLFSAPLGVLFNTIFFTAIATIATFVCLKPAKKSRKLAGFFTIVPIYIVLNVLIFGDVFGIFSKLIPPLGLYPIVGFLASVCLGMLCLSLTAIFCGAGILKRWGAAINTGFSLVCFSISLCLTCCALNFARYTYESELFRNDAGRIDIKDALPFLKNSHNAVLDSGIEIPVIAVLIIFLVIYFLSLTAVKSPEEIRKDELDRRLSVASNSKKRGAAEDDDDSLIRCCANCEHSACIENCRTKMLCRYRGTVASSGVCRKYVYDPLKRKAFRPQIAHLDTSDFDSDDII